MLPRTRRTIAGVPARRSDFSSELTVIQSGSRAAAALRQSCRGCPGGDRGAVAACAGRRGAVGLEVVPGRLLATVARTDMQVDGWDAICGFDLF
jgi:hypothetical protein